MKDNYDIQINETQKDIKEILIVDFDCSDHVGCHSNNDGPFTMNLQYCVYCSAIYLHRSNQSSKLCSINSGQ